MKQKKILGFWAGTRAYYAEMLRKHLEQLERRIVELEIKKRLKKPRWTECEEERNPRLSRSEGRRV